MAGATMAAPLFQPHHRVHSIVDFRAATPYNTYVRNAYCLIFWGGGGGVEVNIMEKSK